MFCTFHSHFGSFALSVCASMSPYFHLSRMDCTSLSTIVYKRKHLCRIFFESKYRLPPYPWSEVCNSLIYFISIIGSAAAGAFMDRIGRNAQVCSYMKLLCNLLPDDHCKCVSCNGSSSGVGANKCYTVLASRM